MTNYEFQDWELIDYREAWTKQQTLFDAAISAKKLSEVAQNTLIFCEHPHVITIGKSGDRGNLLFDAESLAKRGV